MLHVSDVRIPDSRSCVLFDLEKFPREFWGETQQIQLQLLLQILMLGRWHFFLLSSCQGHELCKKFAWWPATRTWRRWWRLFLDGRQHLGDNFVAKYNNVYLNVYDVMVSSIQFFTWGCQQAYHAIVVPFCFSKEINVFVGLSSTFFSGHSLTTKSCHSVVVSQTVI